jgi:hypothetical protein
MTWLKFIVNARIEKLRVFPLRSASQCGNVVIFWPEKALECIVDALAGGENDASSSADIVSVELQ